MKFNILYVDSFTIYIQPTPYFPPIDKKWSKRKEENSLFYIIYTITLYLLDSSAANQRKKDQTYILKVAPDSHAYVALVHSASLALSLRT